MDDTWESAIQRWRGLNLTLLYQAEASHNRSLNLIGSIISEKIAQASQVPQWSTTLATVFGATTTASSITTSHAITPVSSPPSASATATNTVSWQTAFWALAAIAMNTCLQDCGRVCGIRREFALLVRSSPIFCLTDTLIVLMQLIVYTVIEGPSQAIRTVSASRDQHPAQYPPGLVVLDDPRPTRYIIRSILLTMAVIQCIKLFALKGIPWTQFFGACFLSSYTVNALLNACGQKSNSDPAVGGFSRRGRSILLRGLVIQACKLAAMAQVLLWVVTLRPAIFWRKDLSAAADWHDVLPHVPGWIVGILPLFSIYVLFVYGSVAIDLLIILAPAAAMLALSRIRFRPGWLTFAEATSLMFNIEEMTASTWLGTVFAIGSLFLHCWLYPFVFAGITGEYLSEIQMLNHWEDALMWWDPYGLAITPIVIAAFFSYILARVFLFGWIAKKLGFRQLAIANNLGWACLFLFAANLTIALIYYAKGYDPVNTYKPEWTDNLGKLFL